MLMLRSLTYSEVPVGTTEITERVQVLRNLFLYGSTCKYYGTYTGLTELGHVFLILYMSYRAYTYLTDLILVLRILYWSYGTYSCAKVPVGTMSQNRSGSYHIQGQIRLIQIHIRYGHSSMTGTDQNGYIYLFY